MGSFKEIIQKHWMQRRPSVQSSLLRKTNRPRKHTKSLTISAKSIALNTVGPKATIGSLRTVLP